MAPHFLLKHYQRKETFCALIKQLEKMLFWASKFFKYIVFNRIILLFFVTWFWWNFEKWRHQTFFYECLKYLRINTV